jgi:F-type H+-transporting ATPase subunit epsilon
MAESIRLDLVTPERRLFADSVDQVVAEGVLGEFGVLPGHANFITLLAPGCLSFIKDGKRRQVAVSGGFAEVTLNHGVRVMAETAEFAEEIDVERAKAAKERAEKRLSSASGGAAEIDVARAEIALKRALMRLQVAQDGR